MKHICPVCRKISPDSNRWCQEKYCPAENAVEIFDNGEWFGNIEIVELLVVTPSATIYQAKRGNTAVLLKIAHAGCENRLKREAHTFLDLMKSMAHPGLPVLLPAHEQGSVADYPYGWTAVNGTPRIYLVFKQVEGDILGNMLLKIPQPWFQHAGWIMVSLSDIIAFLHREKRLHLCLSPDIILIRFDKQQIPRLTLLDLGLAENPDNVLKSWDPRFCLPAYTAPELISGRGPFSPATDVYGLGLILFQMLAGKPAFDAGLRKAEQIYENIRKGVSRKTGRRDLKNLPEIAEKAVQPDYRQRQPDVIAFAHQLQENLPTLPREKKPFHINWRAVAIVIGSALAISLLLLLAIPIN